MSKQSSRLPFNFEAVSSISLRLIQQRQFRRVLPTALEALQRAHSDLRWVILERADDRQYRAYGCEDVAKNSIDTLVQLAVGDGVCVDGSTEAASCDLGSPVWQRAGWVGGDPQIVLAAWSIGERCLPTRTEIHQAAHMILEIYKHALDYEKLRLGNRRDTLTGLYDRQRLTELVHREALRARRHSLPLSVW